MVIAMALDFKGPMMRVLSEAEDQKTGQRSAGPFMNN